MEDAACWSYATHTGTRDITERMDDILTRHGFRVAVMKADAVAPERREAWVADRVKQGIDVMICHPRLVQTGLDLIDFPTICWYETEFSVFQSTQKSPLLMGSRFGCNWSRIGATGCRGYRSSISWWIELLVDRRTSLPATPPLLRSTHRPLRPTAISPSSARMSVFQSTPRVQVHVGGSA